MTQHGRRLARATLAYQASQVVAMACGLLVTGVLARRTGVSAFGVYGLVLSCSLFLQFMLGAAVTVLVRRLPAARTRTERGVVFGASLRGFSLAGLAAGVLIVAVGAVAVTMVDLSDELAHQARLGILLLALVTTAAWPMRVFFELLGADQRFVGAAVAEMVAYPIWGGAMVVAITIADAPLWILIGMTGAMPLLLSLVGLVMLMRDRSTIPRPAKVSALYMRGYLREARHVAAHTTSNAALVLIGRGALASVSGPAAVGLFEAAFRPSAVLRQLHSSLTRTVVPTSAAFAAEGDEARSRELVLRGTRYVLAATLPLALTGAILAEPLLVLWLGEPFRPAAPAITILVAVHLMEGGRAVAAAMLIGVGRARTLALHSWAVAGLTLILTVALVPALGVRGVAIAYTGAAFALYPFFVGLATRHLPVSFAQLARSAWLPAYGPAIPLAAALLGIRMLTDVAGPAAIMLAVFASLGYWATLYLLEARLRTVTAAVSP